MAVGLQEVLMETENGTNQQIDREFPTIAIFYSHL